MKLQELACARSLARDGGERGVAHALAPQQRLEVAAIDAAPPDQHPKRPTARARSEVPLHLAHEAPAPNSIEFVDLPLPRVERLKALFDLTVAEARLAQQLASGDSVEEVARKLNIKMTTARTQLAAIFAKTNTRRQAKLVAMLSHLAHRG